MKKIFIIIVLMFILSSCFQNQEAINNAKKELGIFKNDNIEKTNNIKGDKENDNIKENSEQFNKKDKEVVKITEKVKKEKKFIVKSLTMNNFIEFDDLNLKVFPNGEIEITGKTLLNVDKIEVSFINKTSDFPIDNYTLKQFKSGDKTFTYRAFSRYQTLDYGKNEYIFTAYSGKEFSKLSLIINIKKSDQKNNNMTNNITHNSIDINKIVDVNKIIYEKKKIGVKSDIGYINFPKSNAFGEMISTGNDSFTYSKIDNFNVIKKDVSNINCGNISEILSKSINTWYYWNTCRDIIKDKGIKFNVIRLDGDKYIYERYYIDYNNSLYGIFLIETGTGVTKDNIKEKNKELKNKEFNSIKLVDNLFYEIVR